MTLSAKIIILEYVCPGLGTIIAAIMFASPLVDLQKAIRLGELGKLNPTPWAFMLGNCFGWLTYSILVQNLWIFFSNIPGFLISIWLNMGAVKLLYQKHHSNEMTRCILKVLLDNERKMLLNYASTLEASSSSSSGSRTSNNGSSYQGLEINDEISSNIEKPFNAKGTVSASTSCTSISSTSTSMKKEPSSNDMLLEKEKYQDMTQHSYSPSISYGAANTDASGCGADVAVVVDPRIQPVIEWSKMFLDVTSQKLPAPASHEKLVLVIVTIWLLCVSVLFLVPSITPKTREYVVASLVNANLVFYYGAPLSTIYEVVKERNSSSIHVPTMITNTLCSMFWTAYGVAVMDLFIAVPNGLGSLLGVFQVLLYLFFSQSRAEKGRRQQQSANHQQITVALSGTGDMITKKEEMELLEDGGEISA